MNWILGVLPLLAVLACPLMMILMTFGMFGHNHGGGCHGNHQREQNEEKPLQDK
ncbi:DUF2933 domain-containing protein [Calorimonas adulescens]|uniref:DUF2933 domain-containing protein n=1 Tax=Calorimonas adulescens TaxID=2606906 RepID=A0A5D8QHR1_9THEO|nr:DUF2933 domain-containing protein [Calorimonas adulescens]TZE83103.1 DUF2933 domain-containing protein [Calorimonas adulescens]